MWRLKKASRMVASIAVIGLIASLGVYYIYLTSHFFEYSWRTLVNGN
jgi:hypothetical protein